MPIYPYLCSACGHRQDVLQKISEPALTHCTQCEKEAFSKQLSAPAFQLKGSGWYVTDFKDNGKKAEVAAEGAAATVPATTPAAPPVPGAAASTAPAPASAPAPAPAAPPAATSSAP
jgi:putative FmdB family regulatory protein